MSAVLYWDKNFKGETSTVTPNDPPCSGPDDYISTGLGKCGYMSCADQIKDHCNSFGGQVSSYKIDDGVVYRAYTEHMYNGNTIDLEGTKDHMPDGWSNKIFSYKVLKNCNNPRWMWDPDCNATNTDNSSKQINSNENTIGICQDDKTNKCFQNKVLLAQTSDLNKDANMLNWCQAHVNECETPLKNYCKTVDNVSSPFCQKWCNNNPGECDKYIIDFCKKDVNNTICSCFLPITDTLKTFAKNNKINPLCLNYNCKTNGYKTTKYNCDACLDKVNLQETNTTKLLDNIQKSCNLISKTNLQIFWDKNYIFIIVGIIVIVLFSVISIFMSIH